MDTVPTGGPTRKRSARNRTGQDLRPTSLFSARWPAGKEGFLNPPGMLHSVSHVTGSHSVQQLIHWRSPIDVMGSTVQPTRRLGAQTAAVFSGQSLSQYGHMQDPGSAALTLCFTAESAQGEILCLACQNQKILPLVVIGAGLLTTGSNRKHQDHVRASNSLPFLIFTRTSLSGYQGFRLLMSVRR